MNKLAFAFAFASVAGTCAANLIPEPPVTNEVAHARYVKMMEKTGGLVEKKGEGTIAFIDCQDFIDSEEVKKRVDKIQYVLKYNTEIRKGAWQFGVGKPEDVKAAIYIVNDPSLPMSLVATEAGWGVVNTVGLKPGNRFSKELTRVFTLVTGGATSQVKTSCLQPVFKPGDLDKLITDGFTFDMAFSVNKTLKAAGVTPNQRASYRKACQEGWAEKPTNEYEQKIWDEIFKTPDAPLTIEFDKEKGK